MDVTGFSVKTTPNDAPIVSGASSQVWDNSSSDKVTLSGSNDSIAFGASGNNVTLSGAGDSVTDSIGGNTVLLSPSVSATLTTLNDTISLAAGSAVTTNGSGNSLTVQGSAQIQANSSSNTLVFQSGVADDQLWFSRSGSDLLLSVIGTSQVVDIQNWYAGASYQIGTIKTQDGHSLLNTQVANLVNAMSGLTQPAAGQTTLSGALANQLEPVITANWHSA